MSLDNYIPKIFDFIHNYLDMHATVFVDMG